MAKRGRPRKSFDDLEPRTLVKRLAAMHCTYEEIGTVMGCSADTIKRNFAEEVAYGRAAMRIALRRMQLKEAQRGNIRMQIWLGQQLLDQATRHHHEGSDEAPGTALIPATTSEEDWEAMASGQKPLPTPQEVEGDD